MKKIAILCLFVLSACRSINTEELIKSSENIPAQVMYNNEMILSDESNVSAFANTYFQAVSMAKDRVEISSKTQEVGSAVENISSYNFEGSRLDISFSAQYVLEAIRAIGSEDVQLFFISDMKPFIIKNKEDESITQLVLPVRTY